MKIFLAGGLSGLLLNQLTRLSPTQGAILMALTAENRGIRGQYSLDAILDYHVPTKSSDVRLAYEQSRWQIPTARDSRAVHVRGE